MVYTETESYYYLIVVKYCEHERHTLQALLQKSGTINITLLWEPNEPHKTMKICIEIGSKRDF